MEIKPIPYLYKDQILLGDFEAERCLKCGATYFTEEAYIEIEKIAKIRKLWGIKSLPMIEKRITTKIKGEIPVVDYRTLFGDIQIPQEFNLTVGVN